MKTLKDNIQVNSFIKKVQQLKGYGDMNSYILVRELKKLASFPDRNLNDIIEDFSSPKTWFLGKMKLISDAEALLMPV